MDPVAEGDVRHLVNLLREPGTRVVVTGPPGCGKTTLCQQIVTYAQTNGLPVRGVLAPEVRHGDARVGYAVVDVCTGLTCPFACLRDQGPAGGVPVGRYLIDPAGLAFARAALAEALTAGGPLIVIDEVGPLELGGGGLMAEAMAALHGPASVLVVVRRDLLTEFLARFVDQRFHVFDQQAYQERHHVRETDPLAD